MAVTTFSYSAPYDISTNANFKQVGQGVGQAFFNFGWQEQTGHGEIVTSNAGNVHTWPNITVAGSATASTRILPVFQGNWVSGTSYTGSVTTNATADYVQSPSAGSSSVTYQCILSTAHALSVAGPTAVQSTSIVNRAIQSIAATSAGRTTYTFATDSSATDAYKGFVFVITGATNGLNNGTFFCVSSSATTLVLSNGVGVVQAGAAGNANATTATCGFFFNATVAGALSNGWNGLSVTTTGFTTNTGQNNTTGTVIASDSTGFAFTFAGVNETRAATATMATAPASDPLHWANMPFEIWKSTGPMSTTHPIYIKVQYAGLGSFTPLFIFQIGTGVDANGRLTGAVTMSTTAPLTTVFHSTAGTASATQIEYDFCGDADNISFALQRNGIALGPISASTQGPGVIIVDRSKTSTGADSDDFVYVAWNLFTAASTTVMGAAIVLNPSLGTIVANSVGTTVATGAWQGTIAVLGNSLTNFGSTPPLPILPLSGFVANPCLGAILIAASDAQQAATVPVWVYGAMHKFLVVNSDCIFAAAKGVNGIASSVATAIRWDS